LLAFAGLWLAYRTRSPYAGLFAGLILLFPLVYYATFTTDEYRIPIEPVLLILATYVVTETVTSPLHMACKQHSPRTIE
jgi:hypothetical protein